MVTWHGSLQVAAQQGSRDSSSCITCQPQIVRQAPTCAPWSYQLVGAIATAQLLRLLPRTPKNRRTDHVTAVCPGHIGTTEHQEAWKQLPSVTSTAGVAAFPVAA
eukprot:GHUV01038529.1.p1 GENE.GHUV01038529.1~~GHUV01038529.1.p1  ORF type:complete len:105 (+),score=15.89 GHUV01038529.1:46-360(+)